MDIFRLLFIGFASFCSEMLQKGLKSRLGQSSVRAKKIEISAKTALWTANPTFLGVWASHGGPEMISTPHQGRKVPGRCRNRPFT